MANEAPERSRFPDGFRIMQGRREYVTYIEHSSLRIWYDDQPYRFERHFHSAVEIIVPVQGEVIYELTDRTYHVQKGEVLIVPPDCIHTMWMNEGSTRHLLLFEPDLIFGMRDMLFVEPVLKTPVYLSGQTELQQEVRQILLQVVACYAQKEPLWNSMCYAQLLQMYARLGQHFMEQGYVYRPEDPNMDTEIIESARLYIDQHYMDDIGLDDVAAFSGFSKYYFSRVFKQKLGVSLSDYLRTKRLSVAEDMLIHTQKPMHEVADASGFGSIATFNRVFKEVKHITPTKYREIYGDFL